MPLGGDALARLCRAEPRLRASGAGAARIFGSAARGLQYVRSISRWLWFARRTGAFGSVAMLPTDIPERDPRSRPQPLG